VYGVHGNWKTRCDAKAQESRHRIRCRRHGIIYLILPTGVLNCSLQITENGGISALACDQIMQMLARTMAADDDVRQMSRLRLITSIALCAASVDSRNENYSNRNEQKRQKSTRVRPNCTGS